MVAACAPSAFAFLEFLGVVMNKLGEPFKRTVPVLVCGKVFQVRDEPWNWYVIFHDDRKNSLIATDRNSDFLWNVIRGTGIVCPEEYEKIARSYGSDDFVI